MSKLRRLLFVFMPISRHSVYCDKKWKPNTLTSSRREGQHLFITEDICTNKSSSMRFERFIGEFEKKVDGFGDKLPTEMEIFLSFDEFDDDGWYYYCVDTGRRCLFWIDKVNLTWMAEAVGSVPSKAHFSASCFFL